MQLGRKFCAGVLIATGLTVFVPSMAKAQVAPFWQEYGFDAPGADAVVSHVNAIVVPYEWQMPDGSVRAPRLRSP